VIIVFEKNRKEERRVEFEDVPKENCKFSYLIYTPNKIYYFLPL
jgi:hypothetical protein